MPSARSWIRRSGILASVALTNLALAASPPPALEFQHDIRPMLEKYCFDCHADGANKGNVAFDEFKSDREVLENHDLWWRALKNLRAGIMPPAKKPQPTGEEKEQIALWIKHSVFRLNPRDPDPGHVTIRRLNRVEYRNTIHDLMGIDFDTRAAFPADETGYGFDNIGDVLTLSPMLLEKYVLAANQIVSGAVPMVSGSVREKVIPGIEFRGTAVESEDRGRRSRRPEALRLSYYKPAAVSNVFHASFGGKYQLAVDLMVNERFVDNVFDYNRCRLIFRVDGEMIHQADYTWEGARPHHYDHEVNWPAGDHEISFELQPLTPDEKQTRTLSMQITSVTVRGPMAKENWVEPKDYRKFFPEKVPDGAAERRAYARKLLSGFARKAFRRPVDAGTVERLVDLAEKTYSESGKTFEAGVAQAMVAILASPRMLFLEERPEKDLAGQRYPRIDEFSLASRLSYFLWSTMPDEELLRLAEAGSLRKNLPTQIERMLKDKRSAAFVRDFTGQWLRARDIESVPIESRFVLAREDKFDPERDRNRKRYRELRDKPEEKLTPAEKEELATIRSKFRRNSEQAPRAELNGELRLAMRSETEKVFDYIIREDRSLLELLDSDYTFLNERLAKHYGITNAGITGDELQLVKLAADSPRGGILTEGTILGVTSNPTRTSPVKRGLFILDSVLGTPPPPPPPNIPPLEDAAQKISGHPPSLRETLALHRENALCASCHNRMDPLGLALENFNAMGMWRTSEFGEPIDSTGELITGEKFGNIHELKRILVKNHYMDFYRTVTEKMLTYAVGRGLEYYDVETMDQIVSRLEAANGRPSVLMRGIIESAPFQKMRSTGEQEKMKLRAENSNIQHPIPTNNIGTSAASRETPNLPFQVQTASSPHSSPAKEGTAAFLSEPGHE